MSEAAAAPSWPAHATRAVPWRQRHRGGTVEDRTFNELLVSLPPFIADRDVVVDSRLSARMSSTLNTISSLDATYGEHLGALATLLLRTESVASSKIEAIEADVADYARALHGIRSNPSASSMAAATQALATLIGSVATDKPLAMESILSAHQVLMSDDPHKQSYAGRIRDMQNWIGGSDHSPRGALFVPPPPDTVDAYLNDLLAFANRMDLPVLAQAAVVHAQFESIHPFTDGNGRIGRALINTVLRRRGATHGVVIPLASAIVVRKAEYFAMLGDYRAGRPEPIISSFTAAAAIAAREAQITAERITHFRTDWVDQVGGVRRGSAVERLLATLAPRPIFSAEELEETWTGARSGLYEAIGKLTAAGVLRPLTRRKRNQVWGVAAMLDELEDLGARIESVANSTLN